MSLKDLVLSILRGEYRSPRRNKSKWWLACNDVDRLTRIVCAKQMSSRKLRLFACACCRRFWEQVSNECRQVVEKVEAFVDAEVTRKQLDIAMAAAAEINQVSPHWYWRPIADLGRSSNWPGDNWVQHRTTMSIAEDIRIPRVNADVEQSIQVRFLRDIVGNPFKPPVIDRSWLTWNFGTIEKLAEKIYSERSFHDMPILGDALQEAGCRDEDILSHCWQDGVHVRGCWVLDLLLEKT